MSVMVLARESGRVATGARCVRRLRDGPMGYVHLDERAVPAVLAARAAGKVISHDTAAMIADAFTWGWATCWFADTGNFAVATGFLPSTCKGKPYAGRNPVAMMDQALWWWTEGPDAFDDPYDPNGVTPVLRGEMRRYMADRWRDGAGECGAVHGWKRKP